MTDRFADRAASDAGPASTGFAITPHDTNEVPEITRALYIGSGGDLVIELSGGGEVTLKAVPTGALLPLRVRKVKLATTAALIVGLA